MEEGRSKGAGVLQGRQRRPRLRAGIAQARRPQLADAGLMDFHDNRNVVVLGDANLVARTAADRLLARLSSTDRCAVCLTGGSSPQKLYELLATEPCATRIPWHRVHWFIG